ncbi:MAG: ATP-dependent Clp protease ATP-binding subunit, partial [Candidatus Levybacteria bacterium]|nr:ATP-dependent Clp protease ATP-binding subunit [Candidatus Levybacteria bacterium]
TQEEILKISSILLSESLATLSDNGIKLTFDERVISKIAQEAYDATFGARNIRRYIADHIESYLSKMILENKIRKGEEEKLSVDETGSFIVT